MCNRSEKFTRLGDITGNKGGGSTQAVGKASPRPNPKLSTSNDINPLPRPLPRPAILIINKIKRGYIFVYIEPRILDTINIFRSYKWLKAPVSREICYR